MAEIMMKMELDKVSLIFLIVDEFGSLNMQIDAVFSSESGGAIICYVRMYSEDFVEEYPFTGIILYDTQIHIEFI